MRDAGRRIYVLFGDPWEELAPSAVTYGILVISKHKGVSCGKDLYYLDV